MSELVDKVCVATVQAGHPPNTGLEPSICWCAGCQQRVARAAIKAVAEWIEDHHQIDKDGSVHLALTWQYTKRPEAKP